VRAVSEGMGAGTPVVRDGVAALLDDALKGGDLHTLPSCPLLQPGDSALRFPLHRGLPPGAAPAALTRGTADRLGEAVQPRQRPRFHAPPSPLLSSLLLLSEEAGTDADRGNPLTKPAVGLGGCLGVEGAWGLSDGFRQSHKYCYGPLNMSEFDSKQLNNAPSTWVAPTLLMHHNERPGLKSARSLATSRLEASSSCPYAVSRERGSGPVPQKSRSSTFEGCPSRVHKKILNHLQQKHPAFGHIRTDPIRPNLDWRPEAPSPYPIPSPASLASTPFPSPCPG